MSYGTFGSIWRQCLLSLLGQQFEYRTGRQPKKSTVPRSRDLFERTMRQLKTVALYKMSQCFVLFFLQVLHFIMNTKSRDAFCYKIPEYVMGVGRAEGWCHMKSQSPGPQLHNTDC